MENKNKQAMLITKDNQLNNYLNVKIQLKGE